MVLDEFLSRNDMARTEWDTFQKLEKDPRITPIGQFIRKLSLDELPQFWNVLKGDMSLVGPRPCMERQRSLYGKGWEHYCAMRPGITGLWQVSGRNRLSYAQTRRTRHGVRQQLVALARHQDPVEDGTCRHHRRGFQVNTIRPVVLCGGSGTRLWPLSRKTLPKQFVPLIDNKSLLLLTLERLRRLNTEVTCVAAEEHRFLVQESIEAADVSGKQLLEPVARNTAAAMAAIALAGRPGAAAAVRARRPPHPGCRSLCRHDSEGACLPRWPDTW